MHQVAYARAIENLTAAVSKGPHPETGDELEVVVAVPASGEGVVGRVKDALT